MMFSIKLLRQPRNVTASLCTFTIAAESVQLSLVSLRCEQVLLFCMRAQTNDFMMPLAIYRTR